VYQHAVRLGMQNTSLSRERVRDEGTSRARPFRIRQSERHTANPGGIASPIIWYGRVANWPSA